MIYLYQPNYSQWSIKDYNENQCCQASHHSKNGGKNLNGGHKDGLDLRVLGPAATERLTSGVIQIKVMVTSQGSRGNVDIGRRFGRRFGSKIGDIPSKNNT